MLFARGAAFFRKFETFYWFGCLVVLAIVIRFVPELPLPFQHKITINENTIPGIVIAFSILATAIWSYLFLLLPVHSMKDIFDDKPTCRYVFNGLYYSLFWASLFLVYVYLEALKGPAAVLGAAAVKQAFADSVPIFGTLLNDFHLILFVAAYTVMDAIVAEACTDERKRRQFSDVVIFVDLPIFCTMVFIEVFLRPMIGLSFYYFEAGVVSFQLIFGSLSVVGFDVLEDEIERAGKAQTAPIPEPIVTVGDVAKTI